MSCGRVVSFFLLFVSSSARSIQLKREEKGQASGDGWARPWRLLRLRNRTFPFSPLQEFERTVAGFPHLLDPSSTRGQSKVKSGTSYFPSTPRRCSQGLRVLRNRQKLELLSVGLVADVIFRCVCILRRVTWIWSEIRD